MNLSNRDFRIDIIPTRQTNAAFVTTILGIQGYLEGPSEDVVGQGHVGRYIGAFNHLGKLLKADLAVFVQIGFHDGLVDNLRRPIRFDPAGMLATTHLLQLLVLQIATHHHLQHNKQLPIADIAIAINVVDLERKPQLLLFVSLGAEGAQPRDKLLEVDISATILVENGDHARCEGIGADLWQQQEFFAINRSRPILPGSQKMRAVAKARIGVPCRVS